MEKAEKKKTKHRGLLISSLIVLGLIFVLVVSFFIYASIYYHAVDVSAYLTSSDKVTVSKTDNGDYLFKPKTRNKNCLAFYPGGKVEGTAYAPFCYKMAEQGIFTELFIMPFNLAIFRSDAANDTYFQSEEDSQWYLCGHSLGGAMAASYVSKVPLAYKGLILLGAYSTADLSKTALKTMTIYGSDDKVLNLSNYKADLKNLPSSNKEVIIEGGCHSYFGNYGMQKGDGTPEISREEQQKQTVASILSLMNS